MSLEIDSITYKYDKHLVLDGVSFEVKPGEIIGILGPNKSDRSHVVL